MVKLYRSQQIEFDVFENANEKQIIIRSCQLEELALPGEMAFLDGRNPGIDDATLLAKLQPGGAFLALEGQEIVGSIVAQNYESTYGFIGMHMVHPDLRRSELANVLLEAAIRPLGTIPIGINCLESQVEYYSRHGFVASHPIHRYEWQVTSPGSLEEHVVSPYLYPIENLRTIDAAVYPYKRNHFLNCWLNQSGSLLLAVLNPQGGFSAYGLLRRCRSGYELSNLVSSDVRSCITLIHALSSAVEENSVCSFAVPAVNKNALVVAGHFGMRVAENYIRMYKNGEPQLQYENIYSYAGREFG